MTFDYLITYSAGLCWRLLCWSDWHPGEHKSALNFKLKLCQLFVVVKTEQLDCQLKNIFCHKQFCFPKVILLMIGVGICCCVGIACWACRR